MQLKKGQRFYSTVDNHLSPNMKNSYVPEKLEAPDEVEEIGEDVIEEEFNRSIIKIEEE